MDNNSIANDCHTIVIYDTTRQQMKVELNVTDDHSVTGIVATLYKDIAVILSC